MLLSSVALTCTRLCHGSLGHCHRAGLKVCTQGMTPFLLLPLSPWVVPFLNHAANPEHFSLVKPIDLISIPRPVSSSRTSCPVWGAAQIHSAMNIHHVLALVYKCLASALQLGSSSLRRCYLHHQTSEE